MTAQLEVSPETLEAEAELALIAELEARASALEAEPTADEIAAIEAQAQQFLELNNRVNEIRSRMAQRANDARNKVAELKQQAERKKRWRMYQVWRVIDSDGICDWTPRNKPEYAIKEVGQVINFSKVDTLRMCRSGTHMARFAYDAVHSYVGDRIARLELEGWIDQSHNFQCEQVKVLAIIGLDEVMCMAASPGFVEDNRGQALMRYFEQDDNLRLYINPDGGSTSRADNWRSQFLRYLRPIVDRVVADDTYYPSLAEVSYLWLMSRGAELAPHLFGGYMESVIDEGRVKEVFDRMVNKSRQMRADACGQPHQAQTAQLVMQRTDRKELELKVRKYVKDNLPDVTIKDFGVSRGKDTLDPNANSSPKYWLDE